ncbi:MAG: hypothetical protein AB8H80_00810 [Planctomycetota bacterium]
MKLNFLAHATVAATIALSSTVAQAPAPLSGLATPSPAPSASQASERFHGSFSQGRGTGVQREGGAIYGLGSAYKARFDRSGMEFTPALGANAPHNLPLHVSLHTITRGSTPLYEDTTQVAPQERQGVVRYDRGNGIVERYEVREDGVKQSFVFDSRPAGSGDLTVRLAVTSELFCDSLDASADHSQHLNFTSGSFGGVSVRDTVGIDALGNRCAGSMRLIGSTLELSLPAAFVDSASYPLVLDPLFGPSFPVFGVTQVDRNPDASFDVTSDSFLLVWTRIYSATDTDVMYCPMDRNGNLGNLGAVTFALTQEINPSVANINERDAFVIAWQQGIGTSFDIAVASILSSNLDQGPTLTFGGNGNQGQPTIGGDSNLLADDFIVAFHDDTNQNIGIRKVDHNLFTNGLQVVGSLSLGNGQFRSTAINKDGGAARHYLVASQRNTAPAGVEFYLIDFDLNILSTAGFLANATHPAVAGNGVDFLLVNEIPEIGNPNLLDIVGADIIVPPSPSMPPQSRSGFNRPINVDVNDQQRLPSVTMLDGEFVVTWNDESGVPGYDFVGRSVAVATAMPTSPLVVRFVPGSIDEPSAVVGEQAACSTKAICLFAQDGNNTTNVHGAFWRLAGAGTLTSYGGGCTGSVGLPLHAATGTAAIDEDITYTLNNVPSVTIAVLFLGFVQTNASLAPLGAPGCFGLLSPATSITRAINSGSTDATLSLPCDTALLGLDIYAQWAVIDGGANALNLIFSNGIAANIGAL